MNQGYGYGSKGVVVPPRVGQGKGQGAVVAAVPTPTAAVQSGKGKGGGSWGSSGSNWGGCGVPWRNHCADMHWLSTCWDSGLMGPQPLAKQMEHPNFDLEKMGESVVSTAGIPASHVQFAG